MKKQKSLWIVLFALLLMASTCMQIQPISAVSLKDTVYYVQFNSNGGTYIAPIYNVRYGTTIELPESNPIRTNYWFRGWYTDASLTTEFDPSEKIYRNLILYAKWEAVSSTPYIMKQSITDGTYSTTATIDITGQNYGNSCQMDLLVYERSLLKSVVFTQNKTLKYIGFELNIKDYVFNEKTPLPVKVTIPSAFSSDNVQIIYTTNRKTVAGIPDGYVNSSNEYVFDAYYSGTYILMEALDTVKDVKDPEPYLTISSSSNKLKLDKQMCMNYLLMNYSGDESQFDFEWFSSKNYIATITKDGVLTGLRPGKTVVSCVTTDGTFVATKTITVYGTLVKSLKTNVSTKKLKIGKTFHIKTTISPSNATVKTLKYTSSNTKVATVTSKGKVKGVKKGTCYIKVAATDGSGKYKRIKIVVS